MNSPYAPPAAPAHAAGEYKPLGWKTKATQITIVTSVILSMILIAVTSVAPLEPNGPPTNERLVYAMLLGLFSLVVQVASLLAGVFFLLWIHQAAKNVRAFGHEGLSFTPGWCVGWWFIPIASIWMPYLAVKEVWRASDPNAMRAESPTAWTTSPVPSTMPVWWATYVIAGFLGLGGGVMNAFASVQKTDPTLSHLVMAFAQFLSLMSAIAIVSIMGKLAARQEASGARLQEG